MLQLYFLARAAEGSSRYLVRLPFKQSLFCFFRNFHLRLSQMGMAERQSGLIFVYLKACILVQKSTLVLKLHKTELCSCKFTCIPVGPPCQLFLERPESDFSEHKLLWHSEPMEGWGISLESPTSTSNVSSN